MKLFAPKEYWEMSKEAIDEITGGCGPGGLGDKLVPDTIYGLSIFAACRIHDFMWHFGVTQEDKDIADRVFKNNMIRIIEAKTKYKIIKWLRIRRANTYYKAVSVFGDGAYWNDKNSEDEFRDVENLQLA